MFPDLEMLVVFPVLETLWQMFPDQVTFGVFPILEILWTLTNVSWLGNILNVSIIGDSCTGEWMFPDQGTCCQNEKNVPWLGIVPDWSTRDAVHCLWTPYCYMEIGCVSVTIIIGVNYNLRSQRVSHEWTWRWTVSRGLVHVALYI